MIVNIYRPPQGKYKAFCSTITDSFFKANLKDNTEIYLLGDFNINFAEKKSLEFKELDFTMKALGLRQFVNEPTRSYFKNGMLRESTLDLIFTNSEFIKSTKVLDMNISDHQAVMITRKKSYIKPTKIDFFGRSYKNYVKEDFQELVQNADWTGFFESQDPNYLWGIMSNIITTSIDGMCPMKNFRVNEFKEPWMTNEAIEAIRDKDRLLGRARRSRREADWLEAKRMRNEVGKNVRNLKADFLKQQQEAHKSNPKKFWSTVSSIIPKKKSNPGEIWLKDKDNTSLIGSGKSASYFNEFFSQVGANLAKEFNGKWNYYGERVDEDIQQISTDREEVIKLCKEINMYKSSGIDELSSRICKDAFLAIPDQLTYLFNCSLSTAIFPDVWKKAKVVPLFKGGNREDVSNYRPVSLLPLPGKLLEKLVHKGINYFLEENEFLCEYQGGFRKGFSTVYTIADLTDDLWIGEMHTH